MNGKKKISINHNDDIAIFSPTFCVARKDENANKKWIKRTHPPAKLPVNVVKTYFHVNTIFVST